MEDHTYRRIHSSPKWNIKKNVRRRISPQFLIFNLTCIIAAIVVQVSHHVVVGELDLPPPSIDSINQLEGDTPDDCEACRSLVKSFDLGLTRTMRGKHEGGDTQWEEQNLKSYADSEIRLVEIQEDLCNELTKGKAQCLKIAEESEMDIEEWWFQQRKKNVRLHDYLCINKLKRCCPEGKYGPTCQACPSNCNKRGTCDGSATRQGSGECICQPGYVGKECGECDTNYYKMRTGDNDVFVCLTCHKACKGGCDGPISANCTECRAGYSRDPETRLCIDINECEPSSQSGNDGLPTEVSKRPCADGTYCVNTDGHYICSSCHQACATCVDYGVDKCIACADDYEMDPDRHICTHFSHHGSGSPYDEGASHMKRYVKYPLVAYYVISVVTIVASILWQVYNNWRTGQLLHRELIGMRQAVSTIAFALTMLLQSDIFSTAISMER